MSTTVAASPRRTTGALDVVLDVAEEVVAERALAGLTLLSHVAYDDGLAERPMHPVALIRPERRVGFRPPKNAPRVAFLANATAAVPSPELPHTILFKPPSGRTVLDASAYEIYAHYSRGYGVKANSEVKRRLLHVAAGATAPVAVRDVRSIDVPGTMIGDRGLLPLLELARLAPCLERFDASDCGLRNSGAEWLAEWLCSDDGKRVASAARASGTPLVINVSSNPRLSIGAGLVMAEAARTNRDLGDLQLAATGIDAVLQLRVRHELDRARRARG